MCREWLADVDKPVEYFKLGPTPVLAFDPLPGSEILSQYCSVRQSKMTTYSTIPFYYSVPTAMESEPFVQVINMHNLSFILYREEQTKDVKAQIVSILPDEKPKTLGISAEAGDIINNKLLFYIDMANMVQSPKIPLYFISGLDSIEQVILNEEVETV